MDHVMRIANDNPRVFLTLFEVIQLLKPPNVFFRPGISTQVMARVMRRQR
jgi:hypothetical protein